MENKEFSFKGMALNGFLMLFISLVLVGVSIFLIIHLGDTPSGLLTKAICIPLIIIGIFILIGFHMQEPNESKAMVFFGKYKGTFNKTGFYWSNPFMTKKKISMRAHNMDVEPIKVNDKNGNPILIGLVLVWRVENVYKSLFEIDSKPENFVRVQSDAALRQVAGQYAYDSLGTSQGELTLRDGGEEINDQLEEKLNQRLDIAGIEVVEARINYLAYAPEIAAVMLRRQQADAIISAREKIVEGAVSMVKLALDKLSEDQVVELDEDKKAAMVSNLMVVLCADEAAQPVVNAGTLHQ